MRIVFINLHVNRALVRTMEQIIKKKKQIAKRRFFLDYLLQRNVEVINYVTLDGSTLPGPIARHTRNYKIREWEVRKVFEKNQLPKNKIQIITSANRIDPSDIVVFRSAGTVAQFENTEDIRGIKIVDHIHFYGDSENASYLKNFKYYFYEVDLNKYCKLYQKNYSWFTGEFIEFPFSYEPRFIVKREFKNRKTKAVAMGTLTKCELPEFIDMYGTEYYQPHRKMILDHAEAYPEELDSFISEYEEKELKKVEAGDNIFVKCYKKTFNYLNSGKQKNYFSFDMVEKYNEYKMFICPEDVNGSYGVGTIEGMACGCAMIGWNYGAFEDMGMTAGVHYISYDGTMENLIERIRYYQRPENQAELEKIAKTGCEFVRENFSQEKVAEGLYNRLLQISESVKH